MSVRQIRLSNFEQIQKRLKEYTGKKINIVLCNRTVHFGELKTLDITHLTFINMRQEKVVLALRDVNEVYVDIQE